MRTLKELNAALCETRKMRDDLRRERTAAFIGLAFEPAFRGPGAKERIDQAIAAALSEVDRQAFAALAGILSEVAQHNSPEAVGVIKWLFCSPVIPFRILAIAALSSMSTPTAAKTIAWRASFWSLSDKLEKQMARALLAKEASGACASCGIPLRRFPTVPGPWTGTLDEFAQLKIEPDHGFVCESCGAIVCPVCSGKKSGELGVRQFVCTRCGARPLHIIFR